MVSFAEQVSLDDVIIRQQENDRTSVSADKRPKSFEEYLVSSGYGARQAGQNAPGRESLAQLAERARRAPRVY
ncbi:MAG: hypothetical protein CL534_15565 [Ahrensia sp.]|nr:hypothetical protein [Ahrensia sp.]